MSSSKTIYSDPLPVTGKPASWWVSSPKTQPEIFLKAAKLETFYAKIMCICMKGLEQRRIQHRIWTKMDRNQVLVHWSQGQKKEKGNQAQLSWHKISHFWPKPFWNLSLATVLALEQFSVINGPKLPSMGLRRVGHDWETSLSLFTFMHWRSKWQPTPVFLPGESQGRGSLVGCCL